MNTRPNILQCTKELQTVFDKKPSRLWYIGEPSLLNGEVLGIVSARKTEPDLALKTSQIMRELVSIDVALASGWHSPLEEEALHILLTHSSRIIFCLAKSLSRFIPPVEVGDLISQRRALLLTHCSPKANRISRDASLRRNRLVLGLSKGLLVLSAPVGSASFKLAQLAMNLGRPVFTPQHPINQGLIASGTLPATMENLQKIFP